MDLNSPLPHPDVAQLEQFSQQVLAWLLEHFRTLAEQSIGATASRSEMEALLREPPPEAGQDFAAVLAEFSAKVAPHAFRVNHPRFLAFVPSAPSFLSVLGDMLCAGTNFFAGVWLEAAGPAQVEIVVLDWLKSFLGYPATAQGVLTSGGSEANLTALVVARAGLDFADRGRAVLYVTEQRHKSIDRAAMVIGLHPDQIRPVRTDEHFRLDPAALAQEIQRDRAAGRLPWALAANAGATNTGVVDPLPTLADLCAAEKLWFHVDAAYGWPAVLTPGGRRDLAGIDRADSVTLDPHKWFAQTFEAGCLLVRDGPQLPRTFAYLADYLQDVAAGTDEINFCDHGIALTRRFRALKIWLSVKVLGVAWHRELAERCCRLADHAYELLQRAGRFEILSPPRLSIVCFRYRPVRAQVSVNRFNEALVGALRATGRAFLSSTLLRNQFALRFCFVNWRTTAGDVAEVVNLLAKLGRELEEA